MRTIGLVGGASYVSTIEYYRIINREMNARRGGLSAARILLNSVDFGDIGLLHEKGDFDGVASLLVEAAQRIGGLTLGTVGRAGSQARR